MKVNYHDLRAGDTVHRLSRTNKVVVDVVDSTFTTLDGEFMIRVVGEEKLGVYYSEQHFVSATRKEVSTMKYIVTKDEDGKEEIFIFPNAVHHDVMYNAVGRLKNQSHGSWQRTDRELVSAGFTDGVHCLGRSETLNVESRGIQDSNLIL